MTSTHVLTDSIAPLDSLVGLRQFLSDPGFRGEAATSFFSRAAGRKAENRQGWTILASFDDVSHAAAHRDLVMPKPIFPSNVSNPAFIEFFARNMFLAEPAAHDACRRVLMAGFGPQAVTGIRSVVATLLDELIPDCGVEWDLVAHVTERLPALVMCELVGVPAVDRPAVSAWSSGLLAELSHAVPAAGSTWTKPIGPAGYREFYDYIGELIDRPPAGSIADRIRSGIAENHLSRPQGIELVLLLFMAGVDTVITGLTNAVTVVTESGAVLPWVTAGDWAPEAVFLEALRLFPPLPFVLRQATAQIELSAGISVVPGEMVALLFAAGNRDPQRFPDPDDFVVGRARPQALSFGHGVFHCVGSAVAVIEGAELIRTLAKREVTRSQPITRWNDNVAFHSPAELWLRN